MFAAPGVERSFIDSNQVLLVTVRQVLLVTVTRPGFPAVY